MSDRGPTAGSGHGGAVIGIGPILTDEDAAAVAEWLLGSNLDAARLEPRLRISSRRPLSP